MVELGKKDVSDVNTKMEILQKEKEHLELINNILGAEVKEIKKITSTNVIELKESNRLLTLELEQKKKELEDIIQSKAYRYTRKIADLVRRK